MSVCNPRWWSWRLRRWLRRPTVDTTSEQRIVLLCARVSTGERVRHEWSPERQVARSSREPASRGGCGKDAASTAPLDDRRARLSCRLRVSPPTTVAAAKKRCRRQRCLQQSRCVGILYLNVVAHGLLRRNNIYHPVIGYTRNINLSIMANIEAIHPLKHNITTCLFVGGFFLNIFILHFTVLVNNNVSV